jgi:hypothetical protein
MDIKKVFWWLVGSTGLIPTGIKADTTIYKADTTLITADNG